MICRSLLQFLVFQLVFSSPHSLDLDVDSNDNVDTPFSSTDIAECTGDASQSYISEDSRGMNPGDDIDSDQNIEKFKRQARVCTPTTGWSPRKEDVQVWRAPSQVPTPVLDPLPWHREQMSHDPDKVCSKPLQPLLVTCGGPEIWYEQEQQIGWVFNCMWGKAVFFPNKTLSNTKIMHRS